MKKQLLWSALSLLVIGLMAIPAAQAATGGCCPGMCCTSEAACCH